VVIGAAPGELGEGERKRAARRFSQALQHGKAVRHDFLADAVTRDDGDAEPAVGDRRVHYASAPSGFGQCSDRQSIRPGAIAPPSRRW
jgi:hypothetical protein